MKNNTFVIIGAGIAGFTAASIIRENDKLCRIIIIGDEKYLPYSRPMMTKAPIIGFDISKFMIKDSKWFKDNNIEVLTGVKALNICTRNKIVELNNTDKVKYDKCIIASGAESFVPRIEGFHKEGVFVARKIEDIQKMRIYKLKAKRAVVIGGGVVGLESAWELKKCGIDVVVLEKEKALMDRILDAQSSKTLKNIVESQGIKVITDVETQEIYGEKLVQEVILKDGSRIPCDMVIMSCGISPNIDIARRSGINTNKAIDVDSNMQTNINDIYACGDCAEHMGINLGLWKESIDQGEVAAYNACGISKEYFNMKPALIFNGINTSLFTFGDIGKNKGITYEEMVIEDDNKKSKYFMVNNPVKLRYGYEKYFFNNDILVGGVLIGDLTKMNILKESVENMIQRDEFIKLLNRNMEEQR